MKRKKRILTAAIAVVLLAVGVLGINPKEVKAATEAKITVSSGKGYEGDTVKVDVSVTENPGMCGMTIGIKYDKAVLTVVEAVGVDDVLPSAGAVINPNGDGFVSYMYGGIEDKSATGKLMTITFKINEGAAIANSTISIGEVAGNMEASNFNGDTVELKTEAGKITVECKHASVKNVEKTAATCTTKGSTDVVCEKCGAVTKTVEIPALGHKYSEYATTKEPTCTEAGEKTATCSVCGDKKTEAVAALGHKYGEYTTTKEPTCTEVGEKTATCSVCGDKKTEAVAALGHKYSEFTITKEATDKEAGKMEAKCTVCGAVETIEIPVVKEADFVIADSEGNDFDSKVVAGEEIVLTFAGIGMENAAPAAGDIRYVPASYKIDKEVKWTEAPYAVVFKAEKAGTYEIVTVYNREIYTGTEWKADGRNMSVKTAVEAAEKTNGNPGAATGDDGASEIMILTMMCALAAGVLFMSSKKRKIA